MKEAESECGKEQWGEVITAMYEDGIDVQTVLNGGTLKQVADFSHLGSDIHRSRDEQ